jgi:cell division protein YceG involved in septum cleavage
VKLLNRKIVRYLAIVTLLLIPIVLARLVDYFQLPAQIRSVEMKVVKIPKGVDIESIADTLLSKQLIGDKQTFLFWAKTLRRDRALKAGYF